MFLPLLREPAPVLHASPASILLACGHAATRAAARTSLVPTTPGAGGHVAGEAHSLVQQPSPGRRCASCWTRTIAGHRKHQLEGRDRHVCKHDTHRPTQSGSQELWERKDSQEGFPEEEALNWVPKERRKGEPVILDRDWREREQGYQGAGHTVSQPWLLQELRSPWPLRPAVGTQPQRQTAGKCQA